MYILHFEYKQYVQIHKLHILAVFKITWPNLSHFYLIGDSIIEVPIRTPKTLTFSSCQRSG